MAESLACERWLYGVLSGDAALNAAVGGRIYAYVAPQTAAMPFLVYQNQAGRDIGAVGGIRIMSTMLYVVKVIAETTSFGDLKVAANRVDTVLQAKSGTNVDGTVIACVRESPFSMAEITDGRNYRHLGGTYRLWVQ